MQQPRFWKRFLIPLGLMAGLHILSGLAYDGAASLAPGPLRNLLIDTFGPLRFLSIWFFAFIGPPVAYYLGASFIERFIIAFANPLLWIAQVEARVACQFSPLEMVYFFFLPWTFGLTCVTLLEFSVAETVCAFFYNRRFPGKVSVFSPLVIAFMIVGAIGIYFGLGRGQQWVYMIVHHYAQHVLH